MSGPADGAPGVIAVLTGIDAATDGLQPIPHRPVPTAPFEVPLRSRDGAPFFIAPHPVLAIERLRYVGEPVAVVIAETQANLAGSFICQESDFDVTATVFEKIVLVADGTPQNGYASGLPTKTVPRAPCAGGYLIGWVIDPASDTPIKFDGLIGDAVVRTSGTAQAGYNAIPIQADPSLANGAAVSTNGNGALMFDGAPGHYQAVTGQVLGDVRSGGNAETFLTLLTLDVKSNRPNNPVFVDLVSTSTEFICWGEVPISAINTGVFVSAPATKVGIFGVSDDTGPTTLLGLSETVENFGGRVSFSNLFNSSVPVPTHFLPTPSPNFLP